MDRFPLKTIGAGLVVIVVSGYLATLYTVSTGSSPATIGRTNKGAVPPAEGVGCAGCHGADSTLNVAISGATALYPGESATYTVNGSKTNIPNNTTRRMGINIASDDNAIDRTSTSDTTLQLISGELTHTTAKSFTPPVTPVCTAAAPCSYADSYQFKFTMPGTAAGGSAHRLYAVVALGIPRAGYKHASNYTVTTRLPAAPSSITVGAITHNSITINWSGTAAGFHARYKAGTSPPSSPTDGTLLYDGSNTSATATGLTPSSPYSFAVWSKVTFGGTTTYSAAAATVSNIMTTAPPPGQFAPQAQWNASQNPTSRGKVLFAENGVNLYNGTTSTSVQTTPAELTVFHLGSGASPGQVIAAWREGTDEGHVWIEGGTVRPIIAPSPYNPAFGQNAEQASIADGCVFVVEQAAVGGTVGNAKNIFKVDPATGATTNLSGTELAPGAARISSSGCKAAWRYEPATGSPKLQYYTGVGTTVLDIDTDTSVPYIDQGKIVYTKQVSGIDQVFVYDTATSTSTQLTAYTDNSEAITFPRTDGRHVFWKRGTTLVGNGGIAVASDVVAISNDRSFDLQRGQLFWKDTQGGLKYLSSAGLSIVGVPPDSIVRAPWMADGHIVYFTTTLDGLTNTGGIRIVGTTPNDAQPSPPAFVRGTNDNGRVTLDWDKVLGATTYNVYFALQPGITKSNYASLTGGTRLTGITTNSRTITGLTNETPYYFIVTTSDATGEGPESMQVSATPFPAWVQANAPSAAYAAVGADGTNGLLAYAGGGTETYKTVDGGSNWTVIGSPVTTGKPVKAITVNGARVYAATNTGKILRSINSGVDWTQVLDVAGYGESIASIAYEPANPNVIYAGDFDMPSSFELVVKSIDNGDSWNITQSGDIHAYVLQTDPTTSGTVYAAGTGTPNLAKSIDGGANWLGVGPANGAVYAMAIDPRQPATLYAGITNLGGMGTELGIYKTTSGGTTWTQKNNGLPTPLPRTNYLLVDPTNSDVYAATSAGFFYSKDGGDNWRLANNGLPVETIKAMAITPLRKLIAAAGTGLYILNLSSVPPPTINNISPTAGPLAGGTVVTINGSNFVSGATVRFGVNPGTSVTFVSSAQLRATTPAASTAGAVAVILTNPDGQGATLAGAFTYSTLPKGDANGDTAVNLMDVIYLLDALFAGGSAPIGSVDVNNDGFIDILDVFYLINYLFAGGPPPVP